MNTFSRFFSIGAMFFLLLLSGEKCALAQEKTNLDTVKAGLYDMGKMWTFDYPPVDYFQKTYHFTPDEKWFEETRLSALRFANYCSASFVSPNGLLMTNHHCARESGTDVQKAGENFNNNGFYAAKAEDERKVPGLYVDQLVKIEDITNRMQSVMKNAADSTQAALRDTEFQKIIKEYQEKEGWKNLEIQPVQFYNGGKYSVYGYKRYKDVRLVFMPELYLGFYGGDYDNFTYPRYDLDCSFFRVYDDTGKPLKTEHYFKFNPQGPDENDAVFVVGNPGSTRRLSTISDLEYNRDVFIPMALRYYRNRSAVLQAFNQKAKNDSLVNVIFIYENSYKARKGELDGLKDPYLMARKAAFEKKFKEAVKDNPSLSNRLYIWDNIDKDNVRLREVFKTNFLLASNPNLVGDLLSFAFSLENYVVMKKDLSGPAEAFRTNIPSKPVKFMEIEEGTLASYLKTIESAYGDNDPYVQKALGGKTPREAASYLLKNTRLNDPEVRHDLLTKDTTFINQFNDPLMDLARITSMTRHKAQEEYKAIQARLFASHSEMGRLLFDIYGTAIPPDATFTLRINDGIVKGYEYNGTLAPAKTTFFGLYDRFYSFNKQYPWNLPLRWQNPPSELLPVSLDFATTNDIIGGNSGSPMINKNREIIGLVFDGNMESLPGGFIYTPESNRAIGVTSAGMLGALKYIYKAKRLESELLGK